MNLLAALQPHDLGIYIPFAIFIAGVIVVFLVLYFRHERRRLWHDTARLALEKGQPIPAENDCQNARERHSPRHDLRSGLILLAVSCGLFMGLSPMGRGPHLIGAYITGGIGIALLLNALITAIFFTKSSDSSIRPPQA